MDLTSEADPFVPDECLVNTAPLGKKKTVLDNWNGYYRVPLSQKKEGAGGVMVIVIGIGHGDTRLIAYHIAPIHLGKVWIL